MTNIRNPLSGLTRHVWLFLVIAVGVSIPQLLSAYDLEIYIKNRGDIPVRVAMMEDAASLFGYGKKVEGWWEIKPSGWRNPLFRRVPSGPTYHLAFAIQDENGRWGAVRYQPRRNTDFEFKSNKSFVVDRTFEPFKKRSQTTAELNQSGGNFVSIPFSWGVADFYSYSDDRPIQIYIDLNPSKFDPIAVYLDGGTAVSNARSQAAPSEMQGFDIRMENRANSSVKFAINYRDIDGKWKTKAWYNFDPQEGSYLASGGNRLKTDNSIYYYYAESTDGSNRVWRGSDLKVEINGKVYGMIKGVDKDGETNIVLTKEGSITRSSGQRSTVQRESFSSSAP